MTNTGRAKCGSRIEAYVEAGGHLARFGGNFLWQIRLEDEWRGARSATNSMAAKDDPVSDTDKAHLLTTALGGEGGELARRHHGRRQRPDGVYATWGGFAPLGSKRASRFTGRALGV